MKKYLLAMLFLSGLLSVSAAEPAIIAGSWNRGTKVADSEVVLYRIIEGKLSAISSYKLQEDTQFGFAFYPQTEDFYVIGNPNLESAQGKYVFYLKPGDRLNVSVNDSTYVLTGKNTPENIAMQKWHDLVFETELRSIYFNSKYGYVNGAASTYVDFFPLLEETAKKAKTYTSSTNNKKFDKAFAAFRKLNLVHCAWIFITTPRSVHPDVSDYPDFYRENSIDKLTVDAQLMRYPFGVNMINGGIMIANKFNNPINENPGQGKTTAPAQKDVMFNRVDASMNEVKNDTVKGALTVFFAGSIREYDQIEKFNTRYGKYVITENQKKRFNDIVAALASKKGAVLKTMDFAGTDIDDKKVSLSDLKGKVVVVDVWATWCGPCKAEIPALKALEKEYHGKDIVFMSISIDDVKNKQIWVDFVKNEKLTGLQLFGGKGMESDVAKLYNIRAIPRFMVFGKSGAIVTDDAPRPSNPDLKKMLDTELAK